MATDAALHIAEEMLRPSSQLPFILNTTILIGFLTTFPVFMVMMFTLKDLDAVLASPLPSLECFYQTTGSKAAATGLQVIVTVCLCCAVFGEWITCSRLVWAFARDVSRWPVSIPPIAWLIRDEEWFPILKILRSCRQEEEGPGSISCYLSGILCPVRGIIFRIFNSVQLRCDIRYYWPGED